MYTIISGTNRPDSNSIKVARFYAELLKNQQVETRVFSLTDVPVDFAFNEMYGSRSAEFEAIIEEYINASEKLVFIVPEYNGGFPGVLKTFIDAVSPNHFKNKKIALIGLSAGRAGSIMGMDALTTVFHYLSAEVLSNKPKLSGIEQILDDSGTINDEECIAALKLQVEKFIRF
jgi:chromate reductase